MQLFSEGPAKPVASGEEEWYPVGGSSGEQDALTLNAAPLGLGMRGGTGAAAWAAPLANQLKVPLPRGGCCAAGEWSMNLISTFIHLLCVQGSGKLYAVLGVFERGKTHHACSHLGGLAPGMLGGLSPGLRPPRSFKRNRLPWPKHLGETGQ